MSEKGETKNYLNLNKRESDVECIICFEPIVGKYMSTCKFCNIKCHNHCWNYWKKKSQNNFCFHCGQNNCIYSKKKSWFWNLILCLFPFLDKKNKSEY